MSVSLTEADVETLAIDWFRSLGYDCAHGSEVSPGGTRPLREAVTEPALGVSLRAAIARLNPKLPPPAVDDVLRQSLRQPTPSLVQNNLRLHQLLTGGVQVEYRRQDGKMVGAFARLIDFDDPRQNEFRVVRQYSVRGDKGVLKRLDLVAFVNGLPLGVLEFKDPTDEQAAIARVNRVFRDKPGGLVVDLLGIAEPLKEALAQYTATKRAGQPTLDQDQAVDKLCAQHEVVRQILHGFDHSLYSSSDDSQRLKTLVAAVEYVLAQENGKERFLGELAKLCEAFALSVPRDEALAIRDELIFYQDIRAQLVKHTVVSNKPSGAHDTAIRQLISQAIAGTGVVDIFEAAGLKSPGVCILDDDFLHEIKSMPQKNLALEALRRLLNDEIKLRSRKNIVEARSFRELLESAILRYQNMAINAAQVIEEMIQLARRLRDSAARGEKLGLSDQEVAFYDALAHHENAREVLGDQNLYIIAREVAKSIRENVSIDWTIKESVRAKLRTAVKRVLRKYGYPPDKQESATDLVIQQAELLCAELTT